MSCEAKLADNFLLEIIPDHDLVRGPLWTISTAHEGHYVRLVDHFSDSYASVQVLVHKLHDFGSARPDRVDPKAILRANYEAIVLLIEADGAASLAR